MPVGLWPRLNNAAPSLQPHYRTFITTTGCSAPVPRIGTLVLSVSADWTSPLASGRQVPAFHIEAWFRVTPPPCRMPPEQKSGIPQTRPRLTNSPWFRHRLVLFDPSSAVRSRSSLQTLPDGIKSRLLLQRSPPSLLTTAACSGLTPAPDCRRRGAHPHLSYSSSFPTSEMCS